MSALSLRLPMTLHKAIKEAAKIEHVSVNQLITLAIAEKLSALDTFDYLQLRAQRANRDKYLNILKKAPNIEPDEQDKL